MKQARPVIATFVRLLLVLPLLLAGHARADDEASQVSQLLAEKQFSEALGRIESHLANKPSDPQMRFLKGVAESRLGRADAALATFTQLTQDYPELPEPYNNLAVLHAGQGRYAEARAALEMAVRIQPDYATAQENLADIYIRLAEQAYAKAQASGPGSLELARKLDLARQWLTRPQNSGP